MLPCEVSTKPGQVQSRFNMRREARVQRRYTMSTQITLERPG